MEGVGEGCDWGGGGEGGRMQVQNVHEVFPQMCSSLCLDQIDAS